MTDDPRIEAVYKALADECAEASPAFGDGECRFCRENAEKAVAAADAAAEAAGWKLVPVEPTKAMKSAAIHAGASLMHTMDKPYHRPVGWDEALAAAPKIGGDDD